MAGISDVTVGVNPQRDDFETGPDGDARDEAPEDVVPDLVAPQELVVIGVRPAAVKLVLIILAAAHVQPPVQAAGHQRQQRGVAQPDQCNPARRELGHRRHRGREEIPGDETEGDVEIAPREQHADKQVVQRGQWVEMAGEKARASQPSIPADSRWSGYRVRHSWAFPGSRAQGHV